MNNKNNNSYFEQIYLSPIGELILNSDGENLTDLHFNNSPQKSLSSTKSGLKVFDNTTHWLDIYFSGKIPSFTPKIKLYDQSNFSKIVLKLVAQIPYGTVTTYGSIANQIAQQLNKPRMSAQAVGKTIGNNPICIIIPCHRVIGANGNLVGFSGGLDNKIKLLQLENPNTKYFYKPKNDI